MTDSDNEEALGNAYAEGRIDALEQLQQILKYGLSNLQDRSGTDKKDACIDYSVLTGLIADLIKETRHQQAHLPELLDKQHSRLH